MALTVAALQAVLDQTQGTFRLDTGTLELPDLTTQCTTYLGTGELVLADVTHVDRTGLRVDGSVSLTGGVTTPGSVTFVVDDEGTSVAGARLEAAVPADSALLSDGARAAVASLAALKPSGPRLVFGCEPGPDGSVAARTGVGVALDFPAADAPTKPYLWAYEPARDGEAWQMAGEFDGVPLADLSRLAELTGTPDGDGFTLPQDAPAPKLLSLTALSVSFAPGKDGGAARLLSMWMRVALGVQWPLFDGQLVVEDLHAEFGVVLPKGAKPRLTAVLGGEVTLVQDIAVDVEITVPGREIRASLAHPVALKPLVEKHFPGAPAPDLTVDDLTLWGTFGGDKPGYGFDLDLADVWKITDQAALSRVTLCVGKAGTETSASLDALWNLGGADLDVHGEWATGSGWKLSAHASNVSPADLFSAFGIAPPPVLKDVALERVALDYDSQAGSFRLDLSGGFLLGGARATLGLTVDLTKSSGEPGYDQQYEGSLSLEIPQSQGKPRVLTFTVQDVQQAEFTATCQDSTGVSFADLARPLGVTDPSADQVLAALGTFDALTVAYASARRSILLAAKEKSGGSLIVVSDKPAGGSRAWAVRVGVGLDARLSQVPLFQGQIPEAEDAGLCGLGALVASEALDAARVTELNKVLAAADATLPLLPTDGLAKGIAFTVELKLPGKTEPTSLAVRGTGGGTGGGSGNATAHPRAITQDGTPVPGAPGGNAPSGTGKGTGLPLVAWIGVQRSAGPLTLRRVGAGFADGTVWVLFDASLGMAGLTVGVDGLGLGIPLSDPLHPKPRLDGLSVAYSRPPLSIEGALVVKEDEHYQPLVEGILAVKAEEFGLTAMGAYARPTAHPDQPSFFLFGKVSGEFGGPPPVQITGISAGFGLNTDLRLPEGDQVLDFPFLQDLGTTDPLQVLDTLMSGPAPWVRPAAGQVWFAAGLAFRIFEFLDGQALLVLEVGDDFAVAVLGTAEARFPKDPSLGTYARVRLGLSAKYRASEGALKVTAQLAPGSFLLDEDCVLTGGFALATWFDGPHAGDFVLTLGGYHPKYIVPTHYPQVPRLGFNWPVTSELTISGGSYFALTPGAIMAGGALDVNFRSGDLHAWLNAHADILIEWAPFHFDAEIGVSIGVSFVLDLWLIRETISVEVGASLRLWGPPTAGEVTVHLWFISFTIGFGDGSARDDRPAPWADVVKQLPAKEDAVRLLPKDGLLPARAADGQGGELWVVGPGTFSFAVRTAVPLSRLDLTRGEDAQEITGARVDIRPRRDEGTNLDSVLTVTLTKDADAEVQDLSTWYAGDTAQNRADLPAALWGAYDGKLTTGSAQQVDDRLMGVDLRLPPPTLGGRPKTVKAGSIAFDERTPDGILPLRQPAALQAVSSRAAVVPVPATPESVTPESATPIPVTPELAAETAPTGGKRAKLSAVTTGTAGTVVDQSRDRLFAAMADLGVSPGTNDTLTTTDGVVAGDIDVTPAPPVPGTPTASERLYVLGAGATVTPVDAQSLTAYDSFALTNPGPAHLAVSPDGSRLSTASPGREHFDAFDITANPPGKAVDLKAGSLSVPTNAKGVAFSPDHAWAYATYAQPDQMLILDFRGGTPAPGHTYGILTENWETTEPADVVTALPWDKSVYIALPNEDRVVKVDVSSLVNPTAKAYLPAGPAPTRLAVDPKGRWVYALNASRSTVTVIDIAAKAIAATLRTGTAPGALAASPDGNRLYVANATTGTVSVFDTSGTLPQESGEPVWVGARPIALAVSTASDRLYVVRAKNRAVQVVDVVADPPVLLPGTVPLPDDPVAIAVTVPPPAEKAPAGTIPAGTTSAEKTPAPTRDPRTTEGGAA
ncbi:YncE family protein [Streptomyces roseifaciens]